MRTFLILLGRLILLFVIVSNYVNLALSAPIVVILCVLSAVFLCGGILINKKNK